MRLGVCYERLGLSTCFEFGLLLLLKKLLTLFELLLLLLFELFVELSGGGELLERLVRVLVVGHVGGGDGKEGGAGRDRLRLDVPTAGRWMEGGGSERLPNETRADLLMSAVGEEDNPR